MSDDKRDVDAFRVYAVPCLPRCVCVDAVMDGCVVGEIFIPEDTIPAVVEALTAFAEKGVVH